MSSIGERLRAARRAAGMTQQELAEAISFGSQTSVSNWEKDVSKPDPDIAVKICRVLGIKLSYLYDYYGGYDEPLSPDDDTILHKYHSLPRASQELVRKVLDHEVSRMVDEETARRKQEAERVSLRPIRYIPLPVSAGRGESLDSDDRAEPIQIPLTDVSRKADFVLRIRGDSMEPEYHDGELLLIQSTSELRPGELGVFVLNGEGFFKKLGEDALISLNGAYDPIRFQEGDQLQVYGRVVGTTERIIEERE